MIAPEQPRPPGKRAIIIGAGLGGLALGIRLQSAGVSTTILEARERPGGCASWQASEGFTFDAGPVAITDPDSFAELWRLSGQDMAADVTLESVTPLWRLSWPDGAQLDLHADDVAMRQAIAQFDSRDLAGAQRLLDHGGEALREGPGRLGRMGFPDLRSMLKALPIIAQHQGWRSAHGLVASQIGNDKLRHAFSFQTLLAGGNPKEVSALHGWRHRLESETGLWHPRGGVNSVVTAMVALFERIGGVIRLGDPVSRIEMMGDHATGAVTQGGWRGDADLIASNADLMHSYRDLLGQHPRGQRKAEKLARKQWTPAHFAVHFGIRGTWPGIPHRSVLFGPRYDGWLTDIFQHGVLPADQMIILNHPSVTDPGLAPEGCSVFSALVPVPHTGKLPIDWDHMGPLYARRILDEIGQRLIPDIHERIVTQFHIAPNDFAADMHAHMGSAFSLAPLNSQSLRLRPQARDAVVRNLYFVGAGAHPGAGIPCVLGGARLAAQAMLEGGI